jgi:hypothetical protein
MITKKTIIILFLLINIIFILNRNFIYLLASSYYSPYNKLINIKCNSKPIIYVISHRYSFIDVLIASKEISKYQQKDLYSVTSTSKSLSTTLNYLFKLTKGINIIWYRTGNNSSKKLNAKLKQKQNIAIFIVPNCKRTGLYYLTKNNDVHTILIDIKSNYKLSENQIDTNSLSKEVQFFCHNILQMLNKQYHVSVEQIYLKKYLHYGPKKFMEKVNEKIYL